MRLSRCMVLLVVLAMMAAGCANGGSGNEGGNRGGDVSGEPVGGEGDGAAEATSLRVAFASEPDFTQIMNFKWLEDLRTDGVEVEELFFDSSQDAFRALVAGEADIAVGTILSAIALVQEGGEDVKLIASDLKAPDYLLVSTPDVESLQDLEGKKVGISTPGDISDTLTRVVLAREGVDVSRVRFLQVGGTSARMSALLEGQISGGAAHAAEGLSAVEQGLKNLFAYGESVSDYLQHGLIVKQSWLDRNPDLAQVTVDRFIDATRWAADNKDEYIEMSAQYVEGLSDTAREQAYGIFQEIGMFAVNGGMSRHLLENTLKIEQEVGALDENAPPIEEWSDSTFVERYLEEHGEI